jgi:type VI secretion system secreted protein VgrG
MSILSQDKRLIHIDSPLGKDKFIATFLEGDEYVNGLFNFNVELFSDDHEITQQQIVGKAVTLTVFNKGLENGRLINGYVTEFAMLDVDGNGLRHYFAKIVPGFWFTTLASENRVFHKKSAKQIIEEVLGAYSKVVTLKLKLSAEYLTREYCVQFDETDFEFVCRLMAEEGISYYFEHAKGSHTMVLADDAQDYFDCTSEKIEYDGGGSHPTKNTVQRWERRYSYHTGGFEFKDYNEYTTTKDNKQVISTKSKLNDVSPYVHKQYGLYHFEFEPEHKHKLKDSYNKALLERSVEHHESGFDIANGASDCSEFAAGGRFKFDHTLATEKDTYLLTHVKITASDGNNRDTSFKNEFDCVPAAVTLRPAPDYQRKRIDHPQLASVLEVKATVPSSSVDPYTQVKVKFPWNSAQNSCWVRVMQSFAGKNWGANFVPRVGQEVVVTYINGDPDRPVVSGAVYNGTNEGPNYTATQSGWKTQYESSKFNELRFDDKGGEEEIYMEAGKDHNFLIHNDQSGKVENNQTLEVIKNRSITVSEGNESTTISQGNQDYTVSKGNQTTKISSGTQTTDVKGAIKITSKTSIELKVGGSTIKMTPTGITMKATKVDCNASAMGTVKAGGILTLKGGLTKIN